MQVGYAFMHTFSTSGHNLVREVCWEVLMVQTKCVFNRGPNNLTQDTDH